MVWTGSIWLRIGTSGGLLWTRWWTFGFLKMLGSSWVAAQLATSQEGLSSVSKYTTNYRGVLYNVKRMYCRPNVPKIVLFVKLFSMVFATFLSFKDKGSIHRYLVGGYTTQTHDPRAAKCTPLGWSITGGRSGFVGTPRMSVSEENPF
jgi:hypothetical protein